MPVNFLCKKNNLYLIADYQTDSPQLLVESVETVIDYGVSCVQLRMKNQPYATVFKTGKQLISLLKPRYIPLIINDYIEIAQAIDADGVHIGQSDKPYTWVRRRLGYDKIIGVSIENIQQAKDYLSLDCDYFGVGPIFPTTTKRDAAPPIGIHGLKEITAILPKPIIAIGGINATNCLSVLSAPITGIAVASAIFSALSPKQSTQTLIQILQSSPLC